MDITERLNKLKKPKPISPMSHVDGFGHAANSADRARTTAPPPMMMTGGVTGLDRIDHDRQRQRIVHAQGIVGLAGQGADAVDEDRLARGDRHLAALADDHVVERLQRPERQVAKREVDCASATAFSFSCDGAGSSMMM